MHEHSNWLTTFFVIAGISLIFSLSSLQRGKCREGEVHFKGTVLIRLLFGLGVPAMLYGAVFVALSNTFKSEWWVCIVLGAVGIAGIAMWPEEIVTSHLAISQARFLGMGRPKTIAWADVDYATENPGNGNIEVVSKSGKKIVHTILHVGHGDFLLIAGHHCRMF